MLRIEQIVTIRRRQRKRNSSTIRCGVRLPLAEGRETDSTAKANRPIMDFLRTFLRAKSTENGGDGAPPSGEKINRPFIQQPEGRAPSRPCLYADKCRFGARNVDNGHRVCLVVIPGTLTLARVRGLVRVRFRAGGGDGQLAVLDALGGDELIREAAHGVGAAAHGQDFHAGVVVEMHVQRRDDQFAVVVLDFRQQVLDVPLMVVVDQRHRAGDLVVADLAEMVDQAGAHQVRHGLRAVGIALGLHHVVQLPCQAGMERLNRLSASGDGFVADMQKIVRRRGGSVKQHADYRS